MAGFEKPQADPIAFEQHGHLGDQRPGGIRETFGAQGAGDQVEHRHQAIRRRLRIGRLAAAEMSVQPHAAPLQLPQHGAGVGAGRNAHADDADNPRRRARSEYGIGKRQAAVRFDDPGFGPIQRLVNQRRDAGIQCIPVRPVRYRRKAAGVPFAENDDRARHAVDHRTLQRQPCATEFRGSFCTVELRPENPVYEYDLTVAFLRVVFRPAAHGRLLSSSHPACR